MLAELSAPINRIYLFSLCPSPHIYMIHTLLTVLTLHEHVQALRVVLAHKPRPVQSQQHNSFLYPNLVLFLATGLPIRIEIRVMTLRLSENIDIQAIPCSRKVLIQIVLLN